MKLLYVCPSKSKTKKFVATFELDNGKQKRVSFGSKGYSDFTGEAGTQEPTTEEQKKKLYRKTLQRPIDRPALSRGVEYVYLVVFTRHK